MHVDPAAFDSVPHLKYRRDERIVNLASLWDGERWHMWTPHPENSGLIKMQGGECVEGGYFAKTPERDTDLYFQFSDLMWKHASWREITHWLYSIEQRIFRISTSLAKLEQFSAQLSGLPEPERISYSSFISSEVEFLFSQARSLFDDLQQIVAALWARTRLTDSDANKKRRDLPADSFRSALERIRTRAYELPRPILSAYDAVAPFFTALRSVRDDVTHGGHPMETVFMVNNEHAVSRSGRLAAMTPNLSPEDRCNENLISLRPVLANLIFSTLQACNCFLAAFAGSAIMFPESLVPEHRYFLRSPHMGALVATHAHHQRTVAAVA